MKQSCQELLLVRKLRNNALIFGCIFLFPWVPTTASPHPPLSTSTCKTNVEEYKVIWRYFFGMYTIYLTFCLLWSHFFSVLFTICDFQKMKPNLKLFGRLGVKADRWSVGLGVDRPGLSLWLFSCLWLWTHQLTSVSSSIQHVFIESQLGHFPHLTFIALPHFEKDLSN